MTRLPTVGADSGAWGTVLNQFLQVGHTASGLNSNIVSAFNVKDDAYGAKGDGATDDTAAIQACINAAVAVTIGGTSGAVVFFPYGAYAISSPLIVDGSRITLFGFGNRKSNTSIFIKFGFDPSYALIVGNTANVFDVAIMGIDFVGPNLTTTTGGGLNLRCQGMKLYQVRVVTFGGNGVVVQAFSGTIFEVFFDDVLLVVNGMNAITPLDNLLIASSCTDSEYHRVISLGPATKNMTRNGFFVNGAGTQKFQNCHAYFCSNDGFKSFGADTQIIGGEWENNSNAGIEVGGARALIQGATCFGNTAEDILATGSTSIVGCACTSTATSNIYLNAAAGGSVSDCFLSGAFSAIYADTTSSGYTLHDNNCSATTAHVLSIAATNSDIHDNVITGGGNIVEITGAQGNHIHGNTLIGGGTITQIGTTTRIRNNPGFNPVGSVTPPTFPATTVAAVNNKGVDVTAFITNGTSAITQIQIAGAGGTYVSTNMNIAASGWAAIRIPVGAGIKFTYAGGTPAWVWMGD